MAHSTSFDRQQHVLNDQSLFTESLKYGHGLSDSVVFLGIIASIS